MYEIDVIREFSAAHSLRDYPGACRNLHGHNWTVQVFLCADSLDGSGMAVDFRTVKKELDAILSELDHHYLNELPAFREMNPTSENLARHIYQRLSDALGNPRVRVSGVRVRESANSGVLYSPGGELPDPCGESGRSC